MTDEAPEPTEDETNAQSEYGRKLAEGLVPTVQELMNRFPPPDMRAASALAGFIQAFTELELSLAVACNINPLEIVRALRMVADDIEHDIVMVLQKRQNELAVPPAPREQAPFKVDF